MKDEKPRLISIGPVGLGYCVEIPAIPPPNSGIFADRITIIPVWDCATVALGLRTVADTTLITNHLGNTQESDRLRVFLANCGKRIELGPVAHACPCDIILVEKNRGSRRWISSLYGPDPGAVQEAIKSALDDLKPECRLFIYLEAAYPPLRDTVFLRSFATITNTAEASLVNFGDTPAWCDIEDRQAWEVCAPHSILQWSLLRQPSKEDLSVMSSHSLAAELAATDTTLVVTRGGQGGIVITANGAVRIRVKKISQAITVGAGGKVSEAVLRGMMGSRKSKNPELARAAFEAATKYVEGMTFRRGDESAVW